MKCILTLNAVFVVGAAPIYACPICFGGAEGHTSDAVNAAVAVLSGVTLCVVSGFAWFAFNLVRRIQAFESGLVDGQQADRDIHG